MRNVFACHISFRAVPSTVSSENETSCSCTWGNSRLSVSGYLSLFEQKQKVQRWTCKTTNILQLFDNSVRTSGCGRNSFQSLAARIHIMNEQLVISVFTSLFHFFLSYSHSLSHTHTHTHTHTLSLSLSLSRCTCSACDSYVSVLMLEQNKSDCTSTLQGREAGKVKRPVRVVRNSDV